MKCHRGDWHAKEGKLFQTGLDIDTFIELPVDCSGDIVYKVKARKVDGQEGFLVYFRVNERDYLRCVIGGWDNTAHGVETFVDGDKKLLVKTDGKIEAGIWYDIEIRIKDNMATLILGGKTIHKFQIPCRGSHEKIYASVSKDIKNQNLIVKVVNISDVSENVEIDIKGLGVKPGEIQTLCLTSEDEWDENTLEDPVKIVPVKGTSEIKGSNFSYQFSANSFTVLRIPYSK